MNEDVIKQIIPAPVDLYFRKKDDKEYLFMPIVCMALMESGEILFCDSDNYGDIEASKYIHPIFKYNHETKEYDTI